MGLLRAIAAAFSLFSVLPMPRFSWEEGNLRWMLCAFPLVGLVVGLICQVWGLACGLLSLPPLLCGAGWTLLPAALTGGIHLDGYMDTADALGSRAPIEKKRAILKDPHCGAFAVIALVMYFTGSLALYTVLASSGTDVRALYAAVDARALDAAVGSAVNTHTLDAHTLYAYALYARAFAPMVPAFILSRVLSGLLLTVLPLAEGSGLARTFVHATDRRRVRTILACEAAGTGLWLLAVGGFLGGFSGWFMLAAALAASARYVRTAEREFGGTSGDLAGWFLQKAEFWMLAALVLARAVEAVL